MTTILYKKWKYIAADKRWVGWEVWWTDGNTKIFHLPGDNYHIYLLNSGIKQMPEKIDQLLRKYFEKSFDPCSLFNLQEDLKITQQWHDFACLVVYVELSWKDVDDNPFGPPTRISTIVKDRAWKLWREACEEINFHYAAWWSWSDWVDGIMLMNPDIEVGDLFELVASKDLYTSPTFDSINFSI